MTENQIGKAVVDAALKVHRVLGPGLLETVYEVVLARELERRGLAVERQVPVPIIYEGLRFDEGFRADLIVEGKVVLELKSIEQIGKVHAKQLLTYLKFKGLKLGFVLNFGANLMKDGIERVVYGLPEENLGVLAALREIQTGFASQIALAISQILGSISSSARSYRLKQQGKLTPRRKDAKKNMTENQIGKAVVDAALKVHRVLGPGLLETVYEVVLARELERRGLAVERQVPVPIVYEGLRFDEGFRADLIVEGKVILELKSIEQIGKVHAKQLLTYLKFKGLKLGFVLNFGASLMKDGIERVVYGLPEENLCVLAALREIQTGFASGDPANEPPRT